MKTCDSPLNLLQFHSLYITPYAHTPQGLLCVMERIQSTFCVRLQDKNNLQKRSAVFPGVYRLLPMKRLSGLCHCLWPADVPGYLLPGCASRVASGQKDSWFSSCTHHGDGKALNCKMDLTQRARSLPNKPTHQKAPLHEN